MKAPQKYEEMKKVKDIEKCMSEIEKPIRKILFENENNVSKTIELSDSAYNYSYLYICYQANYYVMIPIYSNEQTQLRGIGGWSGPANGGTAHFHGSLSNDGKTINVSYFRGLVHTAGGNHNDGADYNVTQVVGIR